MKSKGVAILVLLCVFGVMPGTESDARSVKDLEVQFQDTDTVIDILRGQVDKYVEVGLKSGQHVKGKVASVKENTVRLKQLSGMEYFDAFIKIDAIVTVIVRTKELVR